MKDQTQIGPTNQLKMQYFIGQCKKFDNTPSSIDLNHTLNTVVNNNNNMKNIKIK